MFGREPGDDIRELKLQNAKLIEAFQSAAKTMQSENISLRSRVENRLTASERAQRNVTRQDRVIPGLQTGNTSSNHGYMLTLNISISDSVYGDLLFNGTIWLIETDTQFLATKYNPALPVFQYYDDVHTASVQLNSASGAHMLRIAVIDASGLWTYDMLNFVKASGDDPVGDYVFYSQGLSVTGYTATTVSVA